MSIWVDADACPKVIKEILFRAAERTALPVTLVANRLVHTPPSRYISALQVANGFDVADSEIISDGGVCRLIPHCVLWYFAV